MDANNLKAENDSLKAINAELLKVMIEARAELAKRVGEFGTDFDGASMLIIMDTAICKAKAGAA